MLDLLRHTTKVRVTGNSCGRLTYWEPTAQEPTSNGTNLWSITFDTCRACWAGFDANEWVLASSVPSSIQEL